MQSFSVFLSFLISFFSCSAAEEKPPKQLSPVTESFVHYLGNTAVTVQVSQYGNNRNPFFLQLHHNETTAGQAAKEVLQESGGTLVSIENNKDRYISFSLNRKRYFFDPNRMFSKKGIRENLLLLSRYHSAAAAEIEDFAKALTGKLHSDTVIALHNNTNGKYSVLNYRSDKTLRQMQEDWFRNTETDVDDFLITTNRSVFEALKEKNVSVVLEHNNFPVDDGSLSIYLGKKGKTYVNVEAEYGHLTEQKEMINFLLETLFPSNTSE